MISFYHSFKFHDLSRKQDEKIKVNWNGKIEFWTSVLSTFGTFFSIYCTLRALFFLQGCIKKPNNNTYKFYSLVKLKL